LIFGENAEKYFSNSLKYEFFLIHYVFDEQNL